MLRLGNHLDNVLNTPSGALDLSTPKIMGIVNLTPDSFYDGGNYNTIDDVLKKVNAMLNEGADILDFGGYSTRPGAKDVSEKEEISRVLEPIKEAKKAFPKSIISVDTFRFRVAELALSAGADIINDISAGDGSNEKIFQLVKDSKTPYIIMHKQGSPKNMQTNPQYQNVTNEVFGYLANKVSKLNEMSIYDVVIDPGFGFGKTVKHNYQLLKNLASFQTLGPIMVGVSRKSMINKVLNCNPSQSLNGTSVLHAFSLNNGAKVLRVHDVKPAFEAIQLFEQFIGS